MEITPAVRENSVVQQRHAVVPTEGQHTRMQKLLEGCALEICPMTGVLLVRIPPEVDLLSVRERLSTLKQCYPSVCCIASGRKEKPDWGTFVDVFPEGSIALDGAVTGPTRIDANTRMASWSHHGADCAQDLCTCELVLNAHTNGTLSLFDQRNASNQVIGKQALAFLDHLDQDGIMSLFVLLYGHTLNSQQAIRLQHLVEMEGKADRAAGFCRLRSRGEEIAEDSCDLYEEEAEELKGIFGPLVNARAQFGWLLVHATLQEISQMLNDSFIRVRAYLDGKENSAPLQKDYEIIGEGSAFKIVRQIGSDARMALSTDAEKFGVDAWVIAIEQQNRRYLYTIKFMSETLQGITPAVLQDLLNRFESLPSEEQNLPLEVQWHLQKHVQPQAYFGGHEDILANHHRGSGRSPEQFQDLLNFMVAQCSSAQ